jgi:hypothetical protein
MSVNRRSAQRRDGLIVSAGNTEQPVGTATVSVVPSVNHACTSWIDSRCSRAADAPVPVSQ